MNEGLVCMNPRLTYKIQRQEARWKSSWSVKEAIVIRLWGVAWCLLGRWTPKFMNRWRVFLLRCFGAKIHGRPFVFPSAKIYAPFNLELYKSACIGPFSNIYSLGRIILRERCVISQDVFLCGGTHDFSSRRNPLLVGEIDIGEDVFIGVRALVLPGVRIGKGAVVGAGAVVVHDVSDWTIVGGNPAKSIGVREFKD